MGDLADALVARGMDARTALEIEGELGRDQIEDPSYLAGDEPANTEPADGLMFRVGRVVVKRDDLDVMTHLGGSVTSAATAGFFVGGGHVDGNVLEAAIAGVVIGGWQIFGRLRRKMKRVEPHQYRILALLRSRPLTEGELQAVLDAGEPDLWPIERVREELDRLTKVRLRDGTVTDFVAESDGKWGTCGL